MNNVGSAARGWSIGLLVAVSLPLAGCTNVVSGAALRDQNAVSANVPPLNESRLRDVMLSIDELNSIVGSSSMANALDSDDMSQTSVTVSDPDCLGTLFGAEQQVYGDDWTAVRDQVFREPGDDKEHWVEQTVVVYPSEMKAQKFFADSVAVWERCGGFSVAIDDDGFDYTWQLDAANVEGDYLIQLGTQEDSGGWECQHALTALSNVTVETWACAFGIKDEAAEMARRIIANVAK